MSRLLTAFIAAALFATAVHAEGGGGFVAGTTPSIRPADAPAITSVLHDEQWYSRALFGVSRPYPPSLRFLESQGNWYTPFNYPGAPGPYDLRGWHLQVAP